MTPPPPNARRELLEAMRAIAAGAGAGEPGPVDRLLDQVEGGAGVTTFSTREARKLEGESDEVPIEIIAHASMRARRPLREGFRASFSRTGEGGAERRMRVFRQDDPAEAATGTVCEFGLLPSLSEEPPKLKNDS